MPRTLPKHGTEAGYKAENSIGSACDRCRAAHRVYQRQFSKTSKAKGIKYGAHQVIDSLDTTTKPKTNTPPTRYEPTSDSLRTDSRQSETSTEHTPNPSVVEPEPSLRSRLGNALSDRVRQLTIPQDEATYVETDEIPDYLRDAADEIPDDPDPGGGEWSEVKDDDFVITRQGMVLIEENMGTYLSVVGMTLEIIDPYCGPIFGDNLDTIVKRWSKIVARYPKAANLFLSKGGGTIMDWIGGIQALWPVLYAMYEHHLSGTVKTQNGRVMRVVSPNGDSPVDPTMPPMGQSDYVYSTR